MYCIRKINLKATKNNEGMTLRIGVKIFNKKDLPHESLLKTRQTTKLRNAINNNMSIDIKLSKAQNKEINTKRRIFR